MGPLIRRHGLTCDTLLELEMVNAKGEVIKVTKDVKGEYEIIQVTWDQHDQQTYEREIRALKSAEKELGIKGRIIDCDYYLMNLSHL